MTNVFQTSLSGVIILLGEIATSLFSVLMGIIGSAKLLQALARDRLIPGLSIFGQGTKKNDEPIYAIAITFIIAQVTMFANINQIASFITMTVRFFRTSINLFFSLHRSLEWNCFFRSRSCCVYKNCHVLSNELHIEIDAHGYELKLTHYST